MKPGICSGTGLSKAVSEEVISRRANVVESFLRAGVPFDKNHLRPLLEANNARLTYSSHMAQLKEKILKAERVLILDGSTYLGEALAIILRFIDDDFTIQLVRFRILGKRLVRQELADRARYLSVDDISNSCGQSRGCF